MLGPKHTLLLLPSHDWAADKTKNKYQEQTKTRLHQSTSNIGCKDFFLLKPNLNNQRYEEERYNNKSIISN